jgi:acetoin utilization protein AcuB
MLARDLISTVVPILHPLDSGSRALRLMNEYHLTQLPMVLDNKYLALVEEDDILDLDDAEIHLENMEYNGPKPAIMENAHFYEALKLFNDLKLSTLPVISQENEYLGVLTKDNLLSVLGQYNGVKEPGGILALDMDPRDYSLAEIARIAESNDISLLSVNTITNPASGRLEVLLKTNRQELQGLLATFERFNYNVKYTITEEQEEDLAKRNYDLLMNYISM